jgi:hypothetical protein
VERWRHCTDLSDDTEDYYNKLSSTIQNEDIVRWTADITLAENERCQNPAAMDIMASRLPQPGRNEIPFNESISEKSGSEWIILGISMEEKQ